MRKLSIVNSPLDVPSRSVYVRLPDGVSGGVVWVLNGGWIVDDKLLGPVGLTEEQRRLVADNIGLVGVHLRRFVGNLSVPRRDREREDLFQEGCLGLIQAAQRYDSERGIPFAAFALPRIHNAVSRGLARKFSTVKGPARARKSRSSGSVDRRQPSRCPSTDADPACDARARRAPTRVQCEDESSSNVQTGRKACVGGRDKRNVRCEGERDADSVRRDHAPRVYSLSDESAAQLRAVTRHDPSEAIIDGRDASLETVGERLRAKYERAVRSAQHVLGAKSTSRADRAELVAILVAERFLIPREDAKRPLRQIARETKSSYARVAQCDKQIALSIRQELESDAEFETLARRGRSDPMGYDRPIDPALEHSLARSGADAYVRRFRRSGPVDRANMLGELMGVTGGSVDRLLREHFAELRPAQRERLLRDVARGDSIPSCANATG